MEVDHFKAVSLGTRVITSASEGSQRRYLTVEVQARLATDLIGRGRIFQAIVDVGRFYGSAATRDKA